MGKIKENDERNSKSSGNNGKSWVDEEGSLKKIKSQNYFTIFLSVWDIIMWYYLS